MLVANQRGGTVNSFSVAADTGALAGRTAGGRSRCHRPPVLCYSNPESSNPSSIQEDYDRPLPALPVTRSDWDSLTSREPSDILLARYVRIDSSHPVGRTSRQPACLRHTWPPTASSEVFASPEPGKVNLVARLERLRSRRQAAADQQPHGRGAAVAADWLFDPFAGEVADGHVYGRGALDMKGMGVMELMAMLCSSAAPWTSHATSFCSSTCDNEEIGSPMGAAGYGRRRLRPT